MRRVVLILAGLAAAVVALAVGLSLFAPAPVALSIVVIGKQDA